MSAGTVGFAILILGLFLLIGKVIRVTTPAVQKLFLPSSIIGGFILLFLGPQVFGKIGGPDSGLFTADMLSVWATLPGILISIVFATLFLGKELPKPKRAAALAGPQLSLGIALGSGQYMIALLLTVILLVPLFNAEPMVGALLEIGFEGGHGTAAGMRSALEEVGYESGADIAIGIATVGVVGGILIGIILINWAVRTGRTQIVKGNVEASIDEQKGLYAADEHYPAGELTSRPASVEPLSLHASLVAIAILLGWLLLEGLKWIERMTYIDSFELFTFVPLFPLAMLGGVVVQLVAEKFGVDRLIDDVAHSGVGAGLPHHRGPGHFVARGHRQQHRLVLDPVCLRYHPQRRPAAVARPAGHPRLLVRARDRRLRPVHGCHGDRSHFDAHR